MGLYFILIYVIYWTTYELYFRLFWRICMSKTNTVQLYVCVYLAWIKQLNVLKICIIPCIKICLCTTEKSSETFHSCKHVLSLLFLCPHCSQKGKFTSSVFCYSASISVWRSVRMYLITFFCLIFMAIINLLRDASECFHSIRFCERKMEIFFQ